MCLIDRLCRKRDLNIFLLEFQFIFIFQCQQNISKMSHAYLSDKDEEFFQSLDSFHSSHFVVKEIHTKEKVKKVLEKLEQELAVGYDSDEETTRTQNLLAYLLWSSGGEGTKQAEKLINIAVSKDPTNIIGLANKARILRGRLQFSLSESVLSELRKLSLSPKYEELTINAEAEIAYSFSRFGPSFLKTAIKHYERVVAKRPDNYIWKFGLALAYKRSNNALNSISIKDTFESHTTENSAKLFLNIINNSSTKLLQARSWCELALLMRFRINNCIPKKFPKLSSSRCIREALELCPSDYYVLQICGRTFRYLRDLSASEQYLRRSIEVKDTPFARHHLALTLKTICMQEAQDQKNETSDSKRAITERKDENWMGRIGFVGKIIRTKATITMKCPNDSRLQEATEHLQEAIRLSKGHFPWAIFDLGLVYKMLGEDKKAIESFTDLDLLSDVSTIERINAIEQLGLTKLEMVNNTDLTEQERTAFLKDGKGVLWRAMELQASILIDIPQLAPAWKSFERMEECIKHRDWDTDKSSIKELVRLREIMGKCEDAIPLCEYIDSLEESKHINLKRTLESYIENGKQEDFNNAVLLLKIFSSVEKTRLEISPQLFSTVHIQAGMNSIRHGRLHQARERLNSAYSNLRSPNMKEDGPDVIVLDQCPGDSNYDSVGRLLQKYCNLTVTINDQDCLEGRNVNDYYENMFQCCSSVLIVFHDNEEEPDDPTMSYAKSAVELPDLGPKFIVLSAKDLERGSSFGGLPRLPLPNLDDKDGGRQWIEQFLSLVVKIGRNQ